jgi:hypothetical protein
MTKYLALSCVFLCALGASALAAGPNTRDGEGSVAALFAKSAEGTPQLRAAVTRAVEENPSLATALSADAGTLERAQQQVVGAALADADRHFAGLGTGAALHAERLIESAMPAAAPGILAGYALAGGNGVGAAIPGAGNSRERRKDCVSRAIHHHKHPHCRWWNE